jgi:hypothetical protein
MPFDVRSGAWLMSMVWSACGALRAEGRDLVYVSTASHTMFNVRAAGKAPLLRGQPDYRAGLDADHNVVA